MSTFISSWMPSNNTLIDVFMHRRVDADGSVKA